MLGPAASAEEEKPRALARKETEEWAEIFRRPGPAQPAGGEGGEG